MNFGIYMKSKFFNKGPDTKPQPPFIIQVPSATDISMMKGMTAGGTEDQAERLGHMTKKIMAVQQNQNSSALMTTDKINLPTYWTDLFKAINQGQIAQAFRLFKAIPPNDSVLRPLLLVHSQAYLLSVIEHSINAQNTGTYILNSDIIFTPGTFEILIKDIATTISCPAKICLSFGLPSHHAFSEQGSGFCILNKTAVLIRHAELTHQKQLKYLVVGSDVNRDNGLCEVLMQSASHLDLTHIDIFDSRVYPQEDQSDVNNHLGFNGMGDEHEINNWQKNQLKYCAVDLKWITRKTDKPHPALLFALKKIDEQIKQAKRQQQIIMIFLPTGWDSHENETAYCGKFVNGKMMRQPSAHKYRFNDDDLTYFYEHLFSLYLKNNECIHGIYWGLEGGYDRPMYESQIDLLLNISNQRLKSQQCSQMSMSSQLY